jgi:hypothetical protein
MITGLKGTKHDFGKLKNKACSSCGEDFNPYHPRQKYCSEECQRVNARRLVRESYRRRDYRTVRQYALRYHYGLSLEQYNDMYMSQDGCCAICRKPEELLHVDHCHSTGIVRGLLCGVCNKALGTLGDSIEGIERALTYLKKAYGKRDNDERIEATD